MIDRLLISELIAEYAHRWDQKDALGFSELFAENGAIDWVTDSETTGKAIEGRANIMAYARKAHAERLAGKQSRHHFTNIVFKDLGDTDAVTEHSVLVTHLQPGRPIENVATGYYRILWTKSDDQWLIAHRTLYLDR